jgi:hypothetical protein
MDTRLVKTVRIANREFQEFVDEIAKVGPNIAKTGEAVRRLQKIARRLSQVDRYLANPRPLPATPESEYEILQYKENLKALKRAFETLQYALLAEKSQIENTRANMKAAKAWAHSLRETS